MTNEAQLSRTERRWTAEETEAMLDALTTVARDNFQRCKTTDTAYLELIIASLPERVREEALWRWRRS